MKSIFKTSYTALIAINIIVLVIATLLNFFGIRIADSLMLSSDASDLIFKPWTILTYMFTQFNFLHALCNMMWLYLFGKILSEYFEFKDHTVAIYIISGIIGGIAFMLTCEIQSVSYNYLVGSSASVLGVMTAATVLLPNLAINIFILGEVKLKWIYLIALLLVFIGSQQVSSGIISTEDISHLFGIFSGAIYAILLKKGLLNFKKNFVLQKKDTSNNPKDELNKLLDKVRISGYASLSDKEKAKMVELSKNIH